MVNIILPYIYRSICVQTTVAYTHFLFLFLLPTILLSVVELDFTMVDSPFVVSSSFRFSFSEHI